MNVGGSVGHGGLWGLNVDEGILQDDFSGRTWKVHVHNLDAVKRLETGKRQEQKDQDQQALGKELLACLDTFSTPPSKNKLREELGWRPEKFNKTVGFLRHNGKVVEEEGTYTCGNGRTGKCQSLRRMG